MSAMLTAERIEYWRAMMKRFWAVQRWPEIDALCDSALSSLRTESSKDGENLLHVAEQHRRFMENECSRMDAVVKAAGYARAAWVGDVNGIANDLQEHMHALALALDAYRAPQDAKPPQASKAASMMLPEGSVCGDCAHWLRCKALISTLNPALNSCDFSPSRFKAKPPQAECWRCNGTGKLRFEAANHSSPCPNCGGSGKQAEACEMCGGCGRMPYASLNGDATWPCPKCNGKGTIHGKPSPTDTER